MNIETVRGRKALKEFVRFPNRLYRDNPYFVPQIEGMDLDTLDPRRNRAFEVCEGRYFISRDDSGKVVGRVAAIVNHSYNEKTGRRTCRFAWIDFIDDPAVCRGLLDAVEDYAREKGMNEVEGPVGFLEFDITGILTEGFDQLPTAYGKYNFPYYEKLIKDCGYREYVGYVEYLVTVPDEAPARYAEFAEKVAERYGLKQLPLKTKKDIKPYIRDVFSCMNRCYSSIEGFSMLTDGQCDDLVKQFLPNLIPDLVSIITDASGRVVAFGVTLPSLSKALQKARGHMFPFGWFHLLRALRHNDTLDALLIAIDDEYKDKGVNAMIFDRLFKGIRTHGIKYIESTRELAENHAVRNLWGRFENRIHKRAMTYLKVLE